MPILTASQLAHSFGADDIFEELELKVERRDRVGLVGPNGSGKTTLLLDLAGISAPTKGQVWRQEGLSLGYLRQEAVLTFAGQENTIYEEMQSVYARLREMEIELREMEAAMASGEADDALFERYGALQEAYEVAGGYHYDVDIQRVLSGLGFPEGEWQTPLSHLSGGQKTRVLLGRLLLEQPDLLILDEPTNHLDMPAVEWLERTLKTWAGALIVVSHDRYFLDSVVNRVWDLAHGRLDTYRGSYSSFVQQRQAAWEREMALYTAEKERMESELEFIRKHIAGGKADIARGKLKRLTRDIVLMEEVGVSGREGKSWLEVGGRVRTFSPNQADRRLRGLKPPAYGPPPLAIRLQAEQRSARSVVRGRELQFGYPGSAPLVAARAIQVDRQDCVALIGPNGSGKSTILKTLVGELAPLKGSLKFGDGVIAGYFAQAHEQLNDRSTVLDELLAHKAMSPEDGRNTLAQYLFTGEDVFKQIGDLSGGERARLALALLAADGANLLLLDEPTNHLDIPSQEILEAVLANFEGTIILVTHDRYLVKRLANQIWEIEEGALQAFKGNYEDYQRFRAGEAEEIAVAAEELEWVEEYVPPPVNKREQRDQAHRRYALTNAIADAEYRLQFLAIERQRAREAGNEQKTAVLHEEIAVVEQELSDLNEELERLVA
ncbi:MAG: ribosomal protection-like ABC-F family protein [Candidatus Promineifilaceae bacterium]